MRSPKSKVQGPRPKVLAAAVLGAALLVTAGCHVHLVTVEIGAEKSKVQGPRSKVENRAEGNEAEGSELGTRSSELADDWQTPAEIIEESVDVLVHETVQGPTEP